MSFITANFRHVADGLQEGQFAVGERKRAARLDDLDPIIDNCSTARSPRRSALPPRRAAELDPDVVRLPRRRNLGEYHFASPEMRMDPQEPAHDKPVGQPRKSLHWVQIKHTVEKELREWEPGGKVVTRQLDLIWSKYTGNPPPYGLRDPKIDEKRVLFLCRTDRIATSESIDR
jgi:hypothetical protein